MFVLFYWDTGLCLQVAHREVLPQGRTAGRTVASANAPLFAPAWIPHGYLLGLAILGAPPHLPASARRLLFYTWVGTTCRLPLLGFYVWEDAFVLPAVSGCLFYLPWLLLFLPDGTLLLGYNAPLRCLQITATGWDFATSGVQCNLDYLQSSGSGAG